MESDDTLRAEIAAWRKAAEDAHAWGDGMRLVMLAALFGTDRSGRNAAIERILYEWAVEQIDANPDAENYLELGLDYTGIKPGVFVLATIRREDGETPAGRALRLLAERDAAVARAEAAEAKWRPITEAPRGGSRILLWYPATREDEGLSVEGFWDRLFDGEWMLSRGGNHIDRRVRRPTHWMPLPAGPK